MRLACRSGRDVCITLAALLSCDSCNGTTAAANEPVAASYRKQTKRAWLPDTQRPQKTLPGRSSKGSQVAVEMASGNIAICVVHFQGHEQVQERKGSLPFLHELVQKTLPRKRRRGRVHKGKLLRELLLLPLRQLTCTTQRSYSPQTRLKP